MNKLLVNTLISASIASFGLAGHAQEVTLKVHHFLSATTFIQVGVFAPWCEKLAKESANRIKCQIYPATQPPEKPPPPWQLRLPARRCFS
jgi:TRAP-type C4-dicarboxylate transport system substrate-binding protein